MTNNLTVKSAKSPKRKKIASLDRRKSRSGWFFILPFLIGFVLIYLPMIYDSIEQSLTQQGVGNEDVFVGFANYSEALFGFALDGRTFLEVLIEGLGTLAFELPSILIFSLFMAVMLNQKAAGRGLFRAIFFIPVVLSTGIMETVNAQSMSEGLMSEGIDDGSGSSASEGLVSALDFEVLFASMGATGLTDIVTTAVNNIFNIVNRSGVQMLIFLAGLQSISPAIYESCKIDGATSWETFWKITFPMISPMILVNGIYTIIDSFTVASNPVMSFVASTGMKAEDGVKTAMYWVYFLVVILIVAVIASVLSAFVFYQRKND
ncbi:MAG: sugar ABC transporter permease [Clostridia bacterium]|nr:sugar ABC transporter permease [Clostridia bacterium]